MDTWYSVDRNHRRRLPSRRRLCQFVAIMLAISLGRPAEAQSTRLRLAFLDLPLAEALERLAATGALNLVWQAETLGDRARKRVSCRVEDQPAEAMLQCLTRAAGLDYVRLSTGTYVIVESAALPPALATISGAITDAATGAPIPFASVHFAARDRRVAVTASDGAFRLSALLPGRYDISVRAVGFRPYTGALQLSGDGATMRVPLERAEAASEPIVIRGIRVGDVSARLRQTAVEARDAATVLGPALFLPGAVAPLGASRRDGIGDLHLQGGESGEHPWRLDGIPLYDAANLSGLLGIVSPLVIDRVALHRSGFGVESGSFATGVVDLAHAVPGDSVRRTIRAAVDALAAAARVTTPVQAGKARGALLIAARRGLWGVATPSALTLALQHWSLPDPVLLDRVSGFKGLPAMGDLDASTFATAAGRDVVAQQDVHVASRLQMGLAHELSASGFSLTNGLRHDATAVDRGNRTLLTTDDFAWHTVGAQLTHRWLLGTRVRQQLQLRGSRHALTHDATMQMRGPATTLAPAGIDGREHNAISEVSIAPEWRVHVNDALQVHAGAEITRTSARLDLANRVLLPLQQETGVWRGSAFVGTEVTLAPALQLESGVRVTQLQTGRTFAEPRLAVRGESRAAGTPWSWRIAGGGYHQFVAQFDVASTMPVALIPSLRFWLPADGNTPVAQAWHLAGEGVWRPAAGWEVRGEAYAREHGVLPMFDYGVMFPNAATAAAPASRPFMAASSGWARGGGVRVIRDQRIGATTWRTELGYDVAWAVRRFPSRFGNVPQAPPWLEPRRASAATELSLASGLRAVLRGRSIHDRPWALRQSYYDLFGAAPDGAGLPIDMPGSMRRPVLVDVDAGVSWTVRWGSRQVELAATILNMLNRANVLDNSLRRDAASGSYAMVPRFLPGRQPTLAIAIR
jgi:hypothetical protein